MKSHGKPRHPILDWVTRGKSIRQLIKELQSFEDQDAEVRISLDYGDTHHPVSIIEEHEGRYCVIVNTETHYKDGWQKFMDQVTPESQ